MLVILCPSKVPKRCWAGACEGQACHITVYLERDTEQHRGLPSGTGAGQQKCVLCPSSSRTPLSFFTFTGFGGLGSSSDIFQMVDLWNSAIKFPLSKAIISYKHFKEKSYRCYRPDCFHIWATYFMHWQQELSVYLWNFKKSAARALTICISRQV